ncbi:uncharacterized protein LOC135427697 isoform X2 [Drosophila montana]|uniref:uncharacterized protein LOC135427697 isoform X2 n=1 Tax=Drosophila montana TaxID=40370 RepID=UPI00313E32DF
MSGEMDATEENKAVIVPPGGEPSVPMEDTPHDDPVVAAKDEPIGQLNDQEAKPLIQPVSEPTRDLMLELTEQLSVLNIDLRDKDHLDHLDNLDNLADANTPGSVSPNAGTATAEERKETASPIQQPISSKGSLKTERKKARPAKSTDPPASTQSGSIKSTSAVSQISKQSGTSTKSKEKKKVKASKVVTHKTSQAKSPNPLLSKSGIMSDASILSTPSPQAGRSTSRRSSRGSLGRSASRRSSRSSQVSPSSRSRSITRDSKTAPAKDSNPNQIWGTLRKAKKRSSSKRSLGKLKKKPTDILHSDEDSLSELSGTPPDLSVSRDSKDKVEMIFKRNSLLALLAQIPDIDDISEGSYSSLIGKKQDETDGHFVPPMDGGSENSSLKIPEPSVKHQETTSAVEQVEEESSSEIVSSTSHSLLNLDSLSDGDYELFRISAKQIAEVDEDKDIARTLTSIVVRNSKMGMVNFLDANAENQRQAAIDASEYFLEELVQRTVAHSEQDSVRLRRLLDKDKLIRQLIPLMQQFKEEQLLKTKLEQRVADHFVRKKLFIFVKIPKTFDALNYQRRQSSLVELDRLLEVHNRTFDLAQLQSLKLTEELEKTRIYSDQKVQVFEQLVRTTLLANDSFTHLAGMVNEVLTSMRHFRDELSELRLELLYALHRFAEMQIKSEVLEDLGDGLKMQEYLNKQSDVHVLGTKINAMLS